jgi:DNA integrity scanning protein DisA with diadenylate cyclase activity
MLLSVAGEEYGSICSEDLPHLSRFLAARKKLREESLRETRKETRDHTYLDEHLILTVYEKAKEYGIKTFDETKERDEEGRCGGLLVLIGDAEEPGMYSTWESPDGYGTLGPQVSKKREKITGEYSIENIDELFDRIAENPKKHDLAIYVHTDGRVVSTRTFVNDATDSGEGNARHQAAYKFTDQNYHAVAVMVSAGNGDVSIIQHGAKAQVYDVEDKSELAYAPLIVR